MGGAWGHTDSPSVESYLLVVIGETEVADLCAILYHAHFGKRYDQ